MAKNGLAQARKILGSLPSTPKKEVAPPSKSPAMERWEYIQVGWGVSARGQFGVVFDKFLTVGGMPQLWVCWGGSKLPYPEMPMSVEVYQACGLDEMPQQQEAA